MPELPEVETIRRPPAPLVEGRRLAQARDPRPALVRAAATARAQRCPRRSHDRALWQARQVPRPSSATDEVFLLMHLRMTGTLLYDAPPGTLYTRVRFDLERSPHRLLLRPAPLRHRPARARRRGARRVLRRAPRRRAARPGLHDRAPLPSRQHRRAPIKAVLLDQRRIAGVGNIYANEALFRANIHPLREARLLKRAQVAALRDAVVASLEAGPRRRRCDDRRLPPSRRRQGRLSERVSRARPDRRAVPCVWRRRSASSWPPDAGPTPARPARCARAHAGDHPREAQPQSTGDLVS